MKNLTLICLMLFASTAYSQITLIPDQYFEQYLIDTNIDSDGIINGQVLTSDIEDETILDFLMSQITDLTGIEDFTSLEFLKMESMNITEIDLSNNIHLKRLDIKDVSLINLDLSNNVALEEFLLHLNLSFSDYSSPITSLDLSNNIDLNQLLVVDSFITEIDLSNNSGQLHFLELHYMENLTSVNLKSGFNSALNWVQITNNSDNLNCVQVDNPDAVIAGIDPPYDNWEIGNNPNITDDCQLGIDNNSLEESISIYPNPVNTHLYINNNSTFQIKEIQIHDAVGRKLLVKKPNSNSIDVSHLNSGILFVKLETEQGIVTKKVIKD